MNNYREQLAKQGWQELSPQINFRTMRESFDVDVVISANTAYVNSILIYSHTTGGFETQKDTDKYIDIFCEIIQEIHEVFPELALYYIQNYEGFDPSKYIKYIKTQTQTQPELIETLGKLPFENQKRVCKNPPEIIQEHMPHVTFSKSISAALKELNIK